MKKLIQNIFSVKNNNIHKVITIFGIKFKFKSKKLIKRTGINKNSFLEDIFSMKNETGRGVPRKVITLLGIKLKWRLKIKGTKACSYTGNLGNVQKLVIFASYSSNGRIQDYVVYYLKELRKEYDGIIFIADNPIYESELDKIKDYILYAECKRHGEYDFGSYKRGYNYAKNQGLLTKLDELLLCNDSVYGPIYPLKEVYKKMDNDECDFWGMIESPDITYHLQSWYLVFKSKIIKSNLIGEFLNTVKKEKSFWDVVTKYETKMTKYLIDNGFKADAYIDMNDERIIQLRYKAEHNNLTFIMPLTLVNDYKFPFAKIKLFRDDQKGSIYEDPSAILISIKSKNPILYQYIEKHLDKYDINLKELEKVD